MRDLAKCVTPLRQGWFVVLFLMVVTVLGPQTKASAEISDSDFETSLIERRRDFDAYVAGRKKSSESEVESALVLKKSREASRLENEKNLADYRKTMVRYSMELAEAREREYEIEIADRESEKELERSRFVERRIRRQGIEERSPKIDPYEEFDINFKVAPDSKVSSSGLPSETTP